MSFNPDKINIHELTIEEPEKQAELPFDVERDITPADWQDIEDQLEKNRLSTTLRDLAERAMYIKIINPSIDLKLDDKAWQEMRFGLEDTRRMSREGQRKNKNGRPWMHFAEDAAQMKILDPNADINLNQEAWEGISKDLESDREEGHWSEFLRQAMYIKILDPSMDIELNEEVWQGAQNELKLRRGLSSRDFAQALVFSTDVAAIKILFPERSEKLKIEESDWQTMKTWLEDDRKDAKAKSSWSRWDAFLEQAMLMKIIAAEKVEVTDKGLKLTMPEKKEEMKMDAPEMPEIKQF